MAVNINIPTQVSQTITNGVTAFAPSEDAVFDALALKQDTLTNPVTGTGANGQVSFWTGTGSQSGDNGLFWDNTNKRLGIGTNAPSEQLQVQGNLRANLNLLFGTTLPSRHLNSAQYPGIFVGNSNSSVMGETGTGFKGIGMYANIVRDGVNWVHQDTTQPGWIMGLNYETANTDAFGIIRSSATAGAASFTRLFYIRGNGNVQINTTTDAGFRLDVNGTARVQGPLTVTGLTTASGAIATGSNFTPTLVAAANNNVLVGLDVNPTFTTGAFTGVTNLVARFIGSRGIIQIESATNSQNSSVRLSARTSNSTIVSAGFYQIPSGTNSSYFTIAADDFNPQLSVFRNGNVLIQNGGTITDAGFRLDVNGTARVQGNFTLTAGANIVLQTTTGTRIGTATNQRLSLWNATPDVQPTTAITAAAFVANTSGIVDDTATFGGYTMGQVVAALKRIGVLA
jgi:hypothetical protein